MARTKSGKVPRTEKDRVCVRGDASKIVRRTSGSLITFDYQIKSKLSLKKQARNMHIHIPTNHTVNKRHNHNKKLSHKLNKQTNGCGCYFIGTHIPLLPCLSSSIPIRAARQQIRSPCISSSFSARSRPRNDDPLLCVSKPSQKDPTKGQQQHKFLTTVIVPIGFDLVFCLVAPFRRLHRRRTFFLFFPVPYFIYSYSTYRTYFFYPVNTSFLCAFFFVLCLSVCSVSSCVLFLFLFISLFQVHKSVSEIQI